MQKKSENNLQKPQAVLFDLDNTLYSYDYCHKLAMQSVKNKAVAEFTITEAEFDKLYAQARKDTKAILQDTGSSHSRLIYFSHFMHLLGLDTKVELILRYENLYWQTFLLNMRLYPGAKSLLEFFKYHQIKICLVTNLTSAIQYKKIIQLNLQHIFKVVVTSEEAGVNKPGAKIYDLVKQRLQLPADSNYWMIGDDVKADIQGSKQHLNATTFLLGNADDPAIDYSFSDFKDLHKFIKPILE